jgi:hypothetical protein
VKLDPGKNVTWDRLFIACDLDPTASGFDKNGKEQSLLHRRVFEDHQRMKSFKKGCALGRLLCLKSNILTSTNVPAWVICFTSTFTNCGQVKRNRARWWAGTLPQMSTFNRCSKLKIR